MIAPSDPIKRLDAMLEVLRSPYRVVQDAVDTRWEFAIGHFPSYELSDEDPPVRLTVHPEEIAIDGLLGLYDSRAQEITIFSKGIRRVAKILGVSTDDLTLVVQYHEWAHALLHLGLDREDCALVVRDESQWAERIGRMNTWFSTLDPNLHETLAQLLARQGLCWLKEEARIPDAQKSIDRITRVFEQLMRRAPAAYRIDKYSNVSKSRIIGSIRLLKSGGLVGADAWETTVTW